VPLASRRWLFQARIAADLIELRNKSVFAFFMFNALFVLIVFLLQLNKDNLHITWPLGVKTNITYVEETSEVTCVSDPIRSDRSFVRWQLQGTLWPLCLMWAGCLAGMLTSVSGLYIFVSLALSLSFLNLRRTFNSSFLYALFEQIRFTIILNFLRPKRIFKNV